MNAASTSRQQFVDRVPVLRLLAADACPSAAPARGASATRRGRARRRGTRARTALVSPWSLSHTTRWRGATERAQERLPVRLGLARERLQAPQLRATGLIRPSRRTPGTRFGSGRCSGSRTLNGKSSSNSDPLAGHSRGQCASNTTGANTSDPIHHQRPVPREAQLSGARVGIVAAAPARAPPPPPRGRSNPPPTADQRLSDPARDELILPRRMRPLVELDVTLAHLARVVPRLLARQHLGEAMRTVAVGRDALVVLPTMPPTLRTDHQSERVTQRALAGDTLPWPCSNSYRATTSRTADRIHKLGRY